MNARFFKLLASAALALSLTACSNTTETPKEEAPKAEELVRATEYGKVKGVEENGVEAYYGIPYGKEPVGDLRWKAPQDPDKWDDVKDEIGRAHV